MPRLRGAYTYFRGAQQLANPRRARHLVSRCFAANRPTTANVLNLRAELRVADYGLLTFCMWVSLALSTTAAASGWRALELEGLDGARHAVTTFIGHGQWVVVNIWGPRCPPCIEEMPELGAFHDTYADGPAMVLGIAIDFPSFGYAKAAEVRAFMDDYLLDFPVLLADHSVYAEFVEGRELPAVPTSLVFTPDGRLVVRHIGTLTQAALESYLAKHDSRFSKSGE